MPAIEIHGIEIDNLGRCKHYHSNRDIVGVKFKCCQRYYACMLCHAESTNHTIQKWDRSEFQEDAVVCGNCKKLLSIENYIKISSCPKCEAEFNPNCAKHFHFYFDFNNKKENEAGMIETRISYIEKLTSGIIHLRMKNELEITVEDLKENEGVYTKLLDGQSGMFLVELGSNLVADAETHKILKLGQRGRFKKAEAFLITELPQRLYSRFYQWYHQPSHPVKVFNDRAQAIEWLLKFK